MWAGWRVSFLAYSVPQKATMKKLITALIAARQAIAPIPKEGVNPFHKSKYVTLDAIVNAVTPILSQHGLAIVQLTKADEAGRFVLITQLWHTEGESLESVYILPHLAECSAPGSKTNPNQVMGSAITYARRYAITALLNIAADEDDDGSSRHTPTPTAPPVTDGNVIEWGKYTDPATGTIVSPAPSPSMDEQSKFVLGYCDAAQGIAPTGRRAESVSYMAGREWAAKLARADLGA